MKKMINLRKVLIMLVIAILMVFTSNVLATDISLTLDSEFSNAQIVEEEKTPVENKEPEIKAENTTKNTETVKVETTNTTENQNDNTLPQTGIESFSMIIILSVLVISAIFAYKKVNDFRNI